MIFEDVDMQRRMTEAFAVRADDITSNIVSECSGIDAAGKCSSVG
jgi:hypothetical protein